jgi:RTX calcium-binding nonapeptide repeat (4 copies)
MKRIAIIATSLAAAAALVAPATGQAAITIGSDLAPDPVNAGTCLAGSCTAANTALPGQQVTSPIQGVIVRWRVRAANTETTPVRLRVIRPQSGGVYTGINSSTTQTIPPTPVTTFSFPTQQPIAAGDHIGLDVDTPNSNFLVNTDGQPGVTFARWEPTLANGDTRSPDATFSNSQETTFNADVEPDCDQDGLGDETQDPDTSSCTPSTQVTQCSGFPPTIVGTPGNDTLVGTSKKDVIASLGGDDQVKGKRGKDVICGGEGNDRLKGSKGKDGLNGEAGDDALRGGKSRDALNGGDGTDTCNGGRGKDTGSACETTTKIP